MKLRFLICVLLMLSLLVLASCDKGLEDEGGKEENTGGETEGGSKDDGENGKNEDNAELDENYGKMESDEAPIDYASSDMKEYLNFPNDSYKNITVRLNIRKPERIMAKIQLTELLYSLDKPTINDADKEKNDLTLGIGDAAYVYYRGYYLDESGERIAGEGMSNLGDASPYKLILGSGSFVSGFEYNLIGTDITECAKFERITEGTVAEGMVIYVSYQRTVDEATESSRLTRIDLTDGSADEIYGEGFTASLLGKSIGTVLPEFSVTKDGKEIKYLLKVEFATDNEHGEELPVKVVECYFPHDYGNVKLQNKTAYFEVYVQYADDYGIADYNDEYVRNNLSKIGITEEALAEFEGDGSLEKLESYTHSLLIKEYESLREKLLDEAMWKHLIESAKVIKYPSGNVASIYNDYLADVKNQYKSSGGYIYTGYGVVACKSLEEYASLYFGVSSGERWQDKLLSHAQRLILERLIIYYIVDAEGLTPEESALNLKIAEIKKEYLEEYVDQYLEHYNKTEADYTKEEFEQFIKDRKKELDDYYPEDHYVETVYYEIAIKALKSYIIVN